MGFYVDIAEALDAEGIESRVNDGTLFVPVSEDLEIQFVDITGGTGVPGANVFLAMADVAEDDEEFEAALVGVVFSVEDAVSTVARYVATDLVVGTVRDLIEGTDPRIADLEFVQDPVDALTVSAEVGENSEIVVTFDGESETPAARVQFVTLGEDFEDLMGQAVAEFWGEDADDEDPEPEDDPTGASDSDRRRILEGIAHDIADMTEEVLELGSYTDFDRLFDVLQVAGEQAEAWEELLVPLENFWEDEDDADDDGEDDYDGDAASVD
ncbi:MULTISPECIES: hypothetical protein [Corynebacterium]|uniref:Uncharacterized protein n=1 Tax=Corynebacterium provencense TaxID=1737425 RepID=A0A2Z3YUU8_9CORY|nr:MULTISPECIES: hypothetical protein [Corynebacterium]AWT25817.1 hypothetical protein Csp1_10110 [Corynebacterium provencense]MCI1256629.1 hypothetical protein [Corynebacterium provencense]